MESGLTTILQVVLAISACIAAFLGLLVAVYIFYVSDLRKTRKDIEYILNEINNLNKKERIIFIIAEKTASINRKLLNYCHLNAEIAKFYNENKIVLDSELERVTWEVTKSITELGVLSENDERKTQWRLIPVLPVIQNVDDKADKFG